MREIQFKLPGKIYGSPMPFGDYNPSGDAIIKFKDNKIFTIVLLASDEECLKKAKKDLRYFYKNDGYNIIYLPIKDFGITSNLKLEEAIEKTISQVMSSSNIVIHCSAGIGRTGMFAAILAKRIYGFSGDEALMWIRQNYCSWAVETPLQKKLANDF